MFWDSVQYELQLWDYRRHYGTVINKKNLHLVQFYPAVH